VAVREPETEVDVEDDESLRWYVVAGFVLAVVVGFVVAIFSAVEWAAGCPSSGGQDTNIADDSLRASLCEDGKGAAVLAMPLGWLAGAVLAAVALVRWGGGMRGTVLLVLVFLIPSLLPAAAFAALSRSSTSCPDDKLAAYREWADAGAMGQPPYDCRTF
jgi:hypothetical protein